MSADQATSAVGVETWVMDPAHSLVEFSVKHMMITTVKGRFAELEGSVTRREDDAWVVDVRIDTASIDTHAGQRDDHLRSADFFDSETHPHITFRSTGAKGAFESPGDRFKLVGDLTIRGTTREVELDAIYEGRGPDPWGGERMSFSATTQIDRRDFGLTWNQGLEAGGVLVGNDVKISLDVQLAKQG